MITGLEGPSGAGSPWIDIGLGWLNRTEKDQSEEKKENGSLLHTNTLADSHRRQALPLFRYRQSISYLLRSKICAFQSAGDAVLGGSGPTGIGGALEASASVFVSGTGFAVWLAGFTAFAGAG